MPRSLAPRTCDRWGPLFSIDHSRSRAGCRNWRIDGETRGACSLKAVARVTSLVSPCISIAPAMLDRYLVALPDMSLIPFAPFFAADSWCPSLRCSLKARPRLWLRYGLRIHVELLAALLVFAGELRSTGLLRTDRKHCISCSRTRDVALHLCDETGSYKQRSLEAVAIKWDRCDSGEALTPRHRQAGGDSRNTLTKKVRRKN